MIEPDLLDLITALVRSGFHTRQELLGIICHELHSGRELDPDAVAGAMHAALRKHEEDKRTWPTVTDCDRLASAFVALAERGVIALENAGNTQSDGYDDFRDAYASHADKAHVVGYCFYHWQDLERALRGEGLLLAFGPAKPGDEEAKGSEVGLLVRTELERAGLRVAWDGTFAQRIALPDFVWRRR